LVYDILVSGSQTKFLGWSNSPHSHNDHQRRSTIGWQRFQQHGKEFPTKTKTQSAKEIATMARRIPFL
jgi:hypothetical protein